YYSKTEYKDDVIEKIENFKLKEFDDYVNNMSSYQVEFGFIFPPEFDNQKQQIFLKYFKSNKFFNKFNYLETNQDFTKSNENEKEESTKDLFEYKISVFRNEEESEKERKK
ncbi:hypothetical protein PIROE2DRAFT_64215, partial [Piromyces sp. E2]